MANRPTSRRLLGATLAVGLPLAIALALYGLSGGVKSGPTATPAEDEPEWVRLDRVRADVRAFCAEGRTALAMLDGADLADLKNERQRLYNMCEALYPTWRNTDCPNLQTVMEFGLAVSIFEQHGRVPDVIRSRISAALDVLEYWARNR